MKVGGTAGDGRGRARRLQAEGAPTPSPRRRRPSLARILETARKKGCDRVVINPSGQIVIVMGPAAENGGAKRNPWDEVLIHAEDEERSS
jgi:hypothetical protein